MEILFIILVPLVLSVIGISLIAGAIESVKKSLDDLRK